jgi:hypothetical protein
MPRRCDARARAEEAKGRSIPGEHGPGLDHIGPRVDAGWRAHPGAAGATGAAGAGARAPLFFFR